MMITMKAVAEAVGDDLKLLFSFVSEPMANLGKLNFSIYSGKQFRLLDHPEGRANRVINGMKEISSGCPISLVARYQENLIGT